MWPWEHLAVGYLAFSLTVRVVASRPPSDAEAILVALGTQFPDLVDKPLSWTFDLLPSGTSLAHSILFAIPFCLLAWAIARRIGYGTAGAGFALGYLLHLPGDAAYGLVYGNPVEFDALLWPLVPTTPAGPDGFVAHFVQYLDRHAEFVLTGQALGYLLAEVVLLVGVAGLWLLDGRPGLSFLGVRSRERT